MSDLDLSRYEGHTPEPWREEDPMSDCTFIVVGDSPGAWVVIAQIPDEEELTFVEAKANRALLLDAPKLLAEVKHLTEERDELAEALLKLRNEAMGSLVGAFGIGVRRVIGTTNANVLGRRCREADAALARAGKTPAEDRKEGDHGA